MLGACGFPTANCCAISPGCVPRQAERSSADSHGFSAMLKKLETAALNSL